MVHGLRSWENTEDVKFRFAFLFGLVSAASLLSGAPGVGLLAAGDSPVTVTTSGIPLWQLAIAGLLVGAGTKLGHGCTTAGSPQG
jgi:uncharacterized protein